MPSKDREKRMAAHARYKGSVKDRARVARYVSSEKCKATRARYRKTVKCRTAQARYRKSAKGKAAAAARAAARLLELKERILRRDGERCQECGAKIDLAVPAKTPLAATIDHIRPRSRRGTDDFENLRLVHLRCNSRRSNKGPAQLPIPFEVKPTTTHLPLFDHSGGGLP